MNEVENILVNDAYWECQQEEEEEQVILEKGYRHFKTDEFVPEDEAFEYAFERCTNGTEDEQKEFKAMLVEWFFSGNWVKED